MNRDECIYFDEDRCASTRLAHCKPHCPYWTKERACTCRGKIGRMGLREWREPVGSFRVPGTPAPLALRG